MGRLQDARIPQITRFANLSPRSGRTRGKTRSPTDLPSGQGGISCYLPSMRKSLRVLLVGFTFVASILAFAGIAGAQGNGSSTYVGPPPEQVLSSAAVNPAQAAAAPTAAVSPTATEAPLAFTGSDSLVLVSIGGAAVLIGVGVLVARRRLASA